jgi:hypothetical protein
MEDIYGTAAYNKAFGINPLLYDKNNANGQTEKPNTIGTLTGNVLRPTLTAFNSGIDPSQVYKNAGLAGASGSYTGLNNSWVPSGGASDTHEARNARIAALTAAGMSDSDARIEADNGFMIASTDQPQQQQQSFQSQLQPFQMTQQYQNYMGSFQPQMQSFQQPQFQQMQQQQPQQPQRQQLQTFQSQAPAQTSGGLLGYNQPAAQGNQYGLLNPYATSQR